jgi:hypothetical protein
MTTHASQYESAITAEEYRTPVDCKYRGNITSGSALVDEHGGVRGWHQQIPGDPTWSDRHSAMRGFIPDSRRRLWQTRRGWVVVADSHRYLLGLCLTALRSGVFGTGGRLQR